MIDVKYKSKTPAQFARECHGVEGQMRLAVFTGVFKASLLAKKTILETATARGLKPRPYWVGFDIAGRQNPTALVRLRGGKAYLAQKGSYKKPAGYDIVPRKLGARARRNREVAGLRSSNRSALSIPGIGPRARVHHPPIKPRTFWYEGIALAAPQMHRAFAGGATGAIGRSFHNPRLAALGKVLGG